MKFVYSAVVEKVIDGDTIDATVDLGFRVYTKIRFRLNGIDTAEVTSADPDIRSKALRAKARVADLILNKDVTIKSSKADKYGRWLADVFVNDIHLNEQLLMEDLAKEYTGVGTTTQLWTEKSV